MVGKSSVKCAKCGLTSKENSSLTFHRFPRPSMHGSLKARVWAKFCYPNDDWTTDESLVKLYKQHIMLCGNHFDDSSFTSSAKTRLNKFAIPTEAQNILAQLRHDHQLKEAQETRCRTTTMQMDMEATPSTSQCSQPTEYVTEFNLQSPDLTKCRTTTMQMDMEATPSTFQCSQPTEYVTEFNLQSPDLTKCRTTTMQMDMEATPSTSQCSQPTEYVTEFNLQSPDLTKESRKRKGVLKDLDVERINELTPRKQKLYKKCRRNLTEILRLRRKLKNIKMCERDVLSSLHNSDAVNNIIKSKVSSSLYLLLQSQLKNVPRKLTGRRWSLDDKVLALSIYKKSNSCYRLLRRLFCLPSVSSLKALLNKIPIMCGINDQVIETIKEITKQRSKSDNLCIIAFDEMSIRKNLSYNTKLDQLDGYQDHATQGRTQEIASHALTFMAIGIRKAWKQPIAFYFSGACVTADRLAVLIKEVLSACFGAGLEVVGVVCDLDGVNLRAINCLGSSTDQPFFYHQGHEIVTILDPPHLLKCFRNNFIKHNIQFLQDVQIEGQQSLGVAKWSHIEEFYNLDKNNPNFVFAPALTRQHLQPNGKQKMKVRLAAQVLSHSVAAGLFAKVAQNELPQDAAGTATILSNMDKLFDSMNGDTPDIKRGKKYLTNMSSTSPHFELFCKMREFFSNMKFVGARSKPPSQEGWLRTMNAVERIYKNLKKYNVHTLCVRRLNQDPLENCFGCIRSNCGCNPNPTSVQFIAALKTSIITNLINNNKNSNCLDDKNDILSNFKVFLEKGEPAKNDANSSTPLPAEMLSIRSIFEGVEEFDIPQCSGEMQACAYVCGFIAKKMAVNCEACKKTMFADPNTEVLHLFTSFKEYDDVKFYLKYIQPSFCEMVENAANIINNYLNENSHERKIKNNLKNKCDCLNKDWLKGCNEHKDINFINIIKSTIEICLKRFCTIKNREFVDDASKKSLIRKINILKNV